MKSQPIQSPRLLASVYGQVIFSRGRPLTRMQEWLSKMQKYLCFLVRIPLHFQLGWSSVLYIWGLACLTEAHLVTRSVFGCLPASLTTIVLFLLSPSLCVTLGALGFTDWTARPQAHLPCLTRRYRHTPSPDFTLVLAIWTQTLMLARQALYWLKQLPKLLKIPFSFLSPSWNGGSNSSPALLTKPNIHLWMDW